MKMLLLLFAFCISLQSLTAQTTKIIGPPGGFALEIEIHPKYGNIVYSSNYAGGLFRSTNAGKSSVPLGIYNNSSSVTFIALPAKDTNTIFINIFNKSMKSENSGKDWDLIYEHIGGLKNVFEFNPLNSDIIYMTRDEKELWRSNNKGKKWHLINVFKGDLRDVKIAPSDTSVIYCAAEYGIYRSIDAGLNWEKTLDTSYYDVSRQITINLTNKNSIYFLIGNQLHKSVNGGKTISRLFDDGLNSYVIDPNDTLKIYLLADLYKYYDGNLLRTINGGATWERILDKVPNRNFNLNCLEINPNNSDILYAGVGGIGVFKSEDGGENWSSAKLCSSSPNFIYTSKYDDIDIIFTNIGSWGLLKSNDRGKNWFQPNFELVSEPIEANNVTFNSDVNQLGFLSGYYLQKTIDGGNTWSNTNQFEFVSVVEIHPLNPDVVLLGYDTDGYDVWGDAIIARSEDGGETWQNVKNIGKNTSVQGFVFHPSDSNVIYAYSSKEVFKSIDMGLTWDVKNNGLVYREERYAPISSLAIDINNPNLLYCSQIIDGGLSMSVDGGQNWKQIDSALYQSRKGVSVSSLLLDKNDSERIFAFFSYPKIIDNESEYETGLFLTEDGGKEWNKLTDIPVTKIVADNSSPRNIYIGSKFGIMTFVDTFKVTSIKNIKFTTIPKNFKLYQNYPNPFNPTTTLKYSISSKMKSEKTNVQLVVYDILGSKVKTLVNKVQQPGNYEIEFDAKSLTSGVYYYQIKVGSNTQTKKMVVLK